MPDLRTFIRSIRHALEWRALAALYKLEHIKGCDCPLCQRYEALAAAGRKRA